ncbi:MAG: DUF3149 domain-containing protein [Enterobacterales bacterium]|nr:DUF3149 domain-containing protein [Enterobacterales bacterium]
MELWSELFSDWVGILSFGTIAVVIVIAAYFYVFFSKKMDEDQGQQ